MSNSSKPETRPEFMIILELLPPYSQEDVKQAFFKKVKTMHPDHGGTARDFRAIQEAYEHAKEYVAYRGNKRTWIAKHVELYLEHEKLVQKLQEFGATVEMEATDWLIKTAGDFAELTSSVVSIQLIDSQHAGQVIDLLAKEHELLPKLISLNFRGSQLTNEYLLQLCVFKNLQQLDLRNTPVTNGVIVVAEILPDLISLNLKGSKVGWWAKRKANTQIKRNIKHHRNSSAMVANITRS